MLVVILVDGTEDVMYTGSYLCHSIVIRDLFHWNTLAMFDKQYLDLTGNRS